MSVSKALAFAAACGLLQAAIICAEPVKETRAVLVLYPLGLSSSTMLLVDREIRAVLDESPFQIEFYDEQLDETVFPDQASQREFRDWYARKYRDRKPDVIITVATAPLRFMIESHDRLFPDTPVVFCCANERRAGMSDADNRQFAGVWMTLDPARTVDVALHLQPDTRRIVVVSGTAAVDRHIEGVIKDSLRPYEGRFEITYLTNLGMPELLGRLKQLPKQTVVLYGNIQEDASGRHFLSATQALPRVVTAASAPVFVLADTLVGSGAVGGFVTSFADQGRAAARVALSVLGGESPSAIHPAAEPNVYMFDWRALRRWGLSERRLPAGSAVLFRQSTFWQSYGLYIMGAIALGLAQTMVIAGLLSQRARRKKVEQSVVERLQFESLLSDLSTTFINLPEQQVDANIGTSLGRIAEFLNVERITLYEFSSTKTELTATCWAIDGNNPAPKVIRIDEAPHWTKRILANATITVSDPVSLPKEAALEQQYLQRMGIRSAASVPLKTGSEIIGAMTFGSTTRQLSWTPDLMRQLTILAEVFANAVARKRSMQALLASIAELKNADAVLRESEERFRLVANTAPVFIWMSGTDTLCTYLNEPWLDFVGRPISAELGHGWVEGVHAEDAAGCLETYRQAFDRRERFSVQYRLRRHDGAYRWMLGIGVPRFGHDGLFAGYIGSCLDITERKLAEEALATLGGRLMEAQEQERTRIARELHDDINQRLALLAIELQRFSLDPQTDIHARSEELFNRTVGISGDVQALSHQLHSSKLEFLGVVAAIKGFCAEFANQQPHVTIAFEARGVPGGLPRELSLCLFRVLQEALRNAVKHSGVRHVEVRLEGASMAIMLTIRDRGRGFDPEAAMHGRGLGLLSMRERVSLAKGTILVTSAAGRGTEISVRVPFDTTPDAGHKTMPPTRNLYGIPADGRTERLVPERSLPSETA